ncbi:alpha/beta fold hydrolase [Acidobacteria bacterium ACD]|nr:MAG: alpha/beta fold hydrolase [Acidobacteriota bacterium]MCE7956691.1 alpha/beta fold hydrolase [Acidobacteria bacterium ACB2]MDL1949053.1 alpha/beta fold hydrolase [Acidobacteria bacterium ACD]
MRALLVHGMGRTPASQALLAVRLRQRGLTTHLFGYSTLPSISSTVERLAARALFVAANAPYVLVGHSLGCVLIRAALPLLDGHPPAACFFLAPPSVACRAARRFSRQRLFRLLTGEAGRLLASEERMSSLPVPAVPTRIYAGTAGPRGPLSPFGDEPNDGILAVSETVLGDLPVVEVPALHTFLMNARAVADDIALHALGPRGTEAAGA